MLQQLKPNSAFLTMAVLAMVIIQHETVSATRPDSKSPPNVVVFLVDDLGYMDIEANNPNCFYETPNIDAFSKSGLRFTNGYAANPVCSPTRFSLLTGRYRICKFTHQTGKLFEFFLANKGCWS